MSAVTVNEDRIVEALRRLPAGKWNDVLQFIESLQQATPAEPKKHWTARELLRLPREERDVILAEQAALAEEEYRTNPELTGFEAFGDKDLFVDHPDAEMRR
jgi:hypothetical protein